MELLDLIQETLLDMRGRRFKKQRKSLNCKPNFPQLLTGKSKFIWESKQGLVKVVVSRALCLRELSLVLERSYILQSQLD